MKEWVEKLKELQNKDIQINKLNQQIASVPQEKKKAKDALENEKATLQQAKTKMQNIQKEMQKVENDIADMEQKQNDFKKKSMMIKDNNEYRAALQQIEECSNRISELEDRQLQLMDELEDAKKEYAKEQQAEEAAEKRTEQLINDLDTRKAKCEEQLEKFKQERAEIAQHVTEEPLNKYERMIESRKKSGRDLTVFCEIREDTCTYCNMSVPAQAKMDARKGSITICPYCNVMLYIDE